MKIFLLILPLLLSLGYVGWRIGLVRLRRRRVGRFAALAGYDREHFRTRLPDLPYITLEHITFIEKDGVMERAEMSGGWVWEWTDPATVRHLHRQARATRPKIHYHGLSVPLHCLLRLRETGNDYWWGRFRHFLAEWKSGRWRHLRREFYPWMEHPVAVRAANGRLMLLLLGLLGREAAPEYRWLQRQFRRDLDLLLDDYLYDWASNHGLITDYALAFIASTLPAGAGRESLVQAVLRRSLGRLDYFVSDDGVPLEPATTYWYLIRLLFAGMVRNLRNAGVAIPPRVGEKLQRLDAFLEFTNVGGVCNRMGDSADGNEIALPFARPPVDPGREGLEARLYDTGLLVVNNYLHGVAREQLMINGQNIAVPVHRHDDALSLGFLSRDRVVLNSPGRFSLVWDAAKRQHNHYLNQSNLASSRSGYSNRVEYQFQPVEAFSYVFKIHGDTGAIVERTVRLGPPPGVVEILDRSLDGGEALTSFLLTPGTAVRGPVVFKAANQAAVEILGGNVTQATAGISYAFGQRLEAERWTVSGPQTRLRFIFDQASPAVREVRAGALYRKRAVPAIWRSARIIRQLSLRRIYALNLAWMAVAAGVVILMAVMKWAR